MDQMQEGTFEEAIGRARSKYELFRQFASRTNKELREAQGEVYALLLKIRSDDAIRAAFYRALVSQNMRIGDKEELLLVEYAFFPHVLRPGKDHKGDINKAGRYTKSIKKALAANISPTDFVEFARKQARADTKRKSQPAKRSNVEIGEPPNSTPASPSNPATVVERPASSWDSVFPGGVWFNRPALAQKAVEFAHAAKTQRQIANIAVHFDGERTVVTGITARPFKGAFPYRGSQIGGGVAVAQEAPVGGKVTPNSTLRPTPVGVGVPMPVPAPAVAPSQPQPKQASRPAMAPWHRKS